MASSDVIELGSSDEETEPAPKRRKPPPNAMVHIPNKLLPGLSASTSKNTKARLNPANILKGSIGQAVTVTKISKSNINPFASHKKLNRNSTKGSVVIKPVAGIKQNIQTPVQRDPNIPGSVMPIANQRKLINPVCRFPNKPSPKNIPSTMVMNYPHVVRLPHTVQGKSGINRTILGNTNLPPGITIKRSTPPQANNIKRFNSPHIQVRMPNRPCTVTKTIQRSVKYNTEVPTVNLDDDEPSQALGPQWYLRPEDQDKKPEDEDKAQESKDTVQDSPTHMSTQNETSLSPVDDSKPVEKSPSTSAISTLEKENNKEPEKSNYIEITIEDSPMKSSEPTKGFKVGAELAITIDDSPVKATNDKADPTKSDNEEDQSKNRNSKKKLQYPKTVETVQIVEIEFEPLPQESTNKEESTKEQQTTEKPSTHKESEDTENSSVPSISDNKHDQSKRIFECFDIVEIEESPIKPVAEAKVASPKKNKPTTTKPEYKMSQEIETIDLDDKEKNEFTPTYQSFICLCFQLENSDDMKKIVEKKIKGYYRQVPKQYTESETFIDLVSSKIMAMKADPEKMYLYIKDVVDELNLQRKLAKAQPAKEKEEQEKFLYGEDSEFDAKRQRQIRKLEKTLKKLHRAIQKLEEQEVDFDDEEDSVYLLTESEDDTSAKDNRPLNKEVLLQRYKERSVRVHAKLCQLTNTKMPSEARVVIDPRPGQPKGPAKRIEKWINRKVPIGTPLPFPDFHDVLRCVREANQEDKLGWNEADIMEEARDLFVRCGKKLQRRRQDNEWRLAVSRIPVDTPDPAEDNTELKRKLEENRRLAAKKETDVFNKYADRQNQLKLEAVEIGDKEAEESPVESDEEEHVEITDSLTDTIKRKERLKRLIQEKSKVSDDKEKQHDQTESEKPIENTNKDSNEEDTISKDNEEVEGTSKDTAEKDLPGKESPISNVSIKDCKNTVESNLSSKNKCGKNVDSDIDELHLLEKLYSENEYNSVVGSSDTGTPIAISDTSSSDDKRTKKRSSDVISIENSSYSETEEKINNSSKEIEAENKYTDKMFEKETGNDSMEQEHSSDSVENLTNKTNNEECNGVIENILLASSDEADEMSLRSDLCNDNPVSETCINLKDDNISIGDTLIVENRDLDCDSEASKHENSDKNTITDGSSVEGMEIGPTEVSYENECKLDNNVDTMRVGSLDEISSTEVVSSISPDANEQKSPLEITSIDSVETIEDDNIGAENIKEIFPENSKENDGYGNDKQSNIGIVKEIDTVEDEAEIHTIEEISMDKDSISMMQNAKNYKEDTTDKEIKESNVLIIKDGSIQCSADIPMKEIQNEIKIKNTDNKCEKISKIGSEDKNVVSEAMEVDPVEQRLRELLE